MSLDKDAVFQIVKANTLKVLTELAPGEVTIDKSLTELGANSVDRVEVVIYSLEELNLKVPISEFRGIANLRGLVDLLHRHASAR
jgi:polyketide biosynthesis acyl carrier protein